MILPYTWHKAADAVTDIVFDASKELIDGDTLAAGATATVTNAAGEAVAGLITAGPTVTSPTAALRFAGGDAGETYLIALTLPTASGQTIAATLRVVIEATAAMARLLPRICAAPSVDVQHVDYVRELIRQAQAQVLAYTRITAWPVTADETLDAAAVALALRAYNQLGAEGAASVSTGVGVAVTWDGLDPITKALLDRKRRLW